MEFSHEDSKTSSEEDDRDDTDTNRSYRCVFCKRGFTTAQALGGHMNIHRKDRAKSRHISVSKKGENFSSMGMGSKHEANISDYQTYNPMERAMHTYNLQHRNRFGEEWRWGLSLHIGPSSVDDDKEKRDELDLELRLGQHDP